MGIRTMVDINEPVRCSGEVHVSTYQTKVLTENKPNWRQLSKSKKLELVEDIPSEHSASTQNTTCVGMHSWLSEALHGGQNAPPNPDMIAFGRSDATPQETDTSLNDFVEQIDVAEYAVEGQQIRISTFVGETEANVDTGAGESLSETGIYADSRLLNHAILPRNFPKDSTTTMTVEIVLSFDAA